MVCQATSPARVRWQEEGVGLMCKGFSQMLQSSLCYLNCIGALPGCSELDSCGGFLGGIEFCIEL